MAELTEPTTGCTPVALVPSVSGVVSVSLRSNTSSDVRFGRCGGGVPGSRGAGALRELSAVAQMSVAAWEGDASEGTTDKSVASGGYSRRTG